MSSMAMDDMPSAAGSAIAAMSAASPAGTAEAVAGARARLTTARVTNSRRRASHRIMGLNSHIAPVCERWRTSAIKVLQRRCTLPRSQLVNKAGEPRLALYDNLCEPFALYE